MHRITPNVALASTGAYIELDSSSQPDRPLDPEDLGVHDPFYAFNGLNSAVGAMWLAGGVGGALHGLYLGLAPRAAGSLSWGEARRALWNLSPHYAMHHSNRLGAMAFVFCMAEGLLRTIAIQDARSRYDKSSFTPYPWETDGRMCAIPAAGMTAALWNRRAPLRQRGMVA
eukprot:Sspe_Gene.49289::Locus_26415_Transcript_1_1_Confidence_1.000_Length_700::g.49289::m.49289